MSTPTAKISSSTRQRFCLILVKPSHYDDDGYVIQWFRSVIPSNSLAVLFGLVRDCAERRVLGNNVDIELYAFDESTTRVRPERLARLIRKAGAGMVMMAGVQSNQFPRALDLAKPLRERGIQVCIGGFHVSGAMAMLSGDDADLHRAEAMGVSLFAGEAEGRLEQVLRDAFAGTLKPLYNFMADLPKIEGAPIPLIADTRPPHTLGGISSFDAGRGCPFQCSFCTIINVQGRKSRCRSPDDIEKVVRENVAQGLHRFFITDDNFARNHDWEPILDRLIYLRTVEKMDVGFTLQVDTLCHKIPRFIEKATTAGVKRVFIGLENINPDSLTGAKKRQNKITEYRRMLLAWKQARVVTFAGYIIGFPNDTIESIRCDIEIIKKELPVDLLEFFCLTPLPGSEDHKKLVDAGTIIDPDLNRYDNTHVTASHQKMSRPEWERAYQIAWETYYTMDHMETVLRRLHAKGVSAASAVLLLTWFMGSINIEKIHPLESGLLRFKFRRHRRPGHPTPPAWTFYPIYFAESVTKLTKWALLYLRLHRIHARIKRDAHKRDYMDLALTPVTDEDLQDLEMFHTRAASGFVEREQRQRAKQTQEQEALAL